MTDPDQDLLETPLADRHRELGGRMVPFAGYVMPVQYAAGIMAEHNHTRDAAGLFDVSHMGQAELTAEDGSHETVARAIESLVPADIVNMRPGQQRYTQLLNESGGILDDLMITRPEDEARAGTLLLVVNAACKAADYAHISANLPDGVRLTTFDDKALIAIQGPAAAAVLDEHVEGAADMAFMTGRQGKFGNIDVGLSRSGYTGEDGYEISMADKDAVAVWDRLLKDDRVMPVGLGARDSLRLEAGLCLYGHDIDETTSPIEAGLLWSIQKRRREELGFPGADRIAREIADGPARRLVGLTVNGRAPVREGADILVDGEVTGQVTSGGFGPTVGAPIALGYVKADHAAPGTIVAASVRGRSIECTVTKPPFVKKRFAK